MVRLRRVPPSESSPTTDATRKVAARHVGDPSLAPGRPVSVRQVVWATVLGLMGTAVIAYPAHQAFSVTTPPAVTTGSRPVTVEPAFVVPITMTVVDRPTVFITADRSTRCVIVPGKGTAPSRVDCQLTAPKVMAPARNPGCDTWGASVRLARSVALTCSAPLPAHPDLVLGNRASLKTGDVVCANGPSGLRCSLLAKGIGFRTTPNRITLFPPAAA